MCSEEGSPPRLGVFIPREDGRGSVLLLTQIGSSLDLVSRVSVGGGMSTDGIFWFTPLCQHAAVSFTFVYPAISLLIQPDVAVY